MPKVIDAEDQILGRMASHVAKQALRGNKVDVVNAEKAVITGSREQIMEDCRNKRSRGTHSTGPFIRREPDQFVRRTIRGMLPHRKPKGKAALNSIKCHVGVPEQFEGKAEKPDGSDVSKLNNLKYVTVKEVCKELGAKVEQ